MPCHVKAILQYCKGVDPTILADGVRAITHVDARRVIYANTQEQKDAGLLFVCLVYFGLNMSANETAYYARRSVPWVFSRVQELKKSLGETEFIAKLRTVVQYLDERI